MPHGSGKNIKDSNKSSFEEQISEQELEFYKELEGFFESCEEKYTKSKPEMEIKCQSNLVENNDSTICSTGKINETFIEPFPQWTFDNLYEDIN